MNITINTILKKVNFFGVDFKKKNKYNEKMEFKTESICYAKSYVIERITDRYPELVWQEIIKKRLVSQGYWLKLTKNKALKFLKHFRNNIKGTFELEIKRSFEI